MNALNILNKDDAIERLGGEKEIYLELLKTFLEVYKNDKKEAVQIQLILSANAEEIIADMKYCEIIFKEAHKIKGAAYTIGANLLGDAAFAIESFFKDGNKHLDKESIFKCNSMLKEFSDIYEKTIIEISKILN